MANRQQNQRNSTSSPATRRKDSTKSSKANGSAANTQLQYVCPECNKPVGNQTSIECFKCEEWFHKKCTNLDETTYECLSRNPTCEWSCEKCFSNGLSKKAESNKIEKMFETLLSKIGGINERLERLEQGKEAMEEKLNDLIDKKVEEKVELALEEMKEEEKRKNNIIVSNFPETSEEDGAGIENAERESFIDYIGKETELIHDDIVQLHRLGKKTEGRPRLLKIELKDCSTKERVTKAAFRMNRGKEAPKRVYVNNDLTPKQREKELALRKELKERREAENPDLVIRNGKIVPRKTGQTARNSAD